MVELVMVMSCTERFLFFLFRPPFRIQVFISAPYEFRSFVERLAALQPFVMSDRILGFLLQRCQAERAASAGLFSHLQKHRHPLRKGGFKGKWWKTSSRVYPMRVLGGGRMLPELVRWDKTGCLRLCDLANDQADVKRC